MKKKHLLTQLCAICLVFLALSGTAHAGSSVHTQIESWDFKSRGYVDLGNDPSLMSNTLSISGWVRPTTPINYFVFFSYTVDNFVAIYAPAQQAFWLWDGSSLLSSANTYAMVAGTWYHLVFQKTSGGLREIWLDGTRIAFDNSGSTATTTGNLYLGLNGNDFNQGFYGDIDEVKVMDRLLTPTEITAEYNAGAGLYGNVLSGAISSYHLDEGTASSTADYIGTNTGTLTGTASWSDNYIVPSVPATCSRANCDACLTDFDCVNTCGTSRWYNNLCNLTDDPTCVVGALIPTITQIDICLQNGQYWSDWTYDTGAYCYIVNCALPPVLPEINYCGGNTSSTIPFVYSDYTTDWASSTPLFAPILSGITNTFDPVFCWFNKFTNLFDTTKSAQLGVDSGTAFITIVSNLRAFNGIFGSIPVAESLILLILVYVAKAFFELGRKVIGIFKV